MAQTDIAHKVRSSVFRRVSIALGIVAVLAAGIFGIARGVNAAPRQAHPIAGGFTLTLPQMQQMIFVWASGTPQVQALARQQCAAQGLDAAACAQVSADVRAAWRDLMMRDPASVGRLHVMPHLAARAQILRSLAARLSLVPRLRLPALAQATNATYQQISSP